MHTKVQFEEALVALRNKQSVRRASWKAVVPPVVLKKPEAKLKPSSNARVFYQIRINKDGSEARTPWLPNLDDLLCKDWVVS